MTTAEVAPVAAVALLRHNGSALLQLRDDDPSIVHPGLWVFPGGHGHPGEDPIECARRELEEETAYRASELDHLADLHDPEEGAPSVVRLYTATYDELQPIECREGRELRWFSRDDARSLPMPRFLVEAWDTYVVPFQTTTPRRSEASA